MMLYQGTRYYTRYHIPVIALVRHAQCTTLVIVRQEYPNELRQQQQTDPAVQQQNQGWNWYTFMMS